MRGNPQSWTKRALRSAPSTFVFLCIVTCWGTCTVKAQQLLITSIEDFWTPGRILVATFGLRHLLTGSYDLRTKR